MKKLVKRLFAVAIALFLGLNIYTFDSHADAVVSLSISASQVSVGEGVSVTVSVSGSLSAYTLYVSYDSSVLEYSSCSGSAIGNGGGGSVSLSGTGEGSTTISFSAIGNGTSYVGTSGEAFDIDGNDVTVSNAGVQITVGAGSNSETTTEKSDNTEDANDDKTETTEATTEDNKSADCDLASLSITPGELVPAFSPEVTAYYVHVEEDVKSMVVSAVAASDKATTAVYGAELIEPGENTVRINVTAENGAVKVYSLRVVAGKELGEACATINNVMYRFVNDTSKLEKPEGFTETTAKYKDWEVLAYEAPNKKFKIVSLVKEEDMDKSDVTYEWFIINEQDETLTPYFELSAYMNKYVIISKPANVQVPEGFKETKISIGKNVFVGYKSDNVTDANLALVYAMNIEGEEGFYFFDSKEVTFMRYIPVVVREQVVMNATGDATPTVAVVDNIDNGGDEGDTKKILLYSTIGLGVLFVLMTIWLAFTKLKKAKIKEELSKAEDMIEQLASVNNKVNKDVLANVEAIEEDKEKSKSKKKDKKNQKKDADIKEAVDAVENAAFDKAEENDIKHTSDADKDLNDIKHMLDDDKELKDIMDMVISEVKQSGMSDASKNKAEYDAQLDSAFADIDNNK